MATIHDTEIDAEIDRRAAADEAFAIMQTQVRLTERERCLAIAQTVFLAGKPNDLELWINSNLAPPEVAQQLNARRDANDRAPTPHAAANRFGGVPAAVADAFAARGMKLRA